MKKAVFLLSALALVGCDEDDVKNTLDGNVEVFAVTSAKLDNFSNFENYESLNISIPEGFPGSSKTLAENKLGSLGIEILSTSCGTIDTSSGNVCFGENGTEPCVPSEVETLGLTLFLIDASDVKRASDNGYYPKLAAEALGSTYSNYTINDESCDSITP